MKRLLFAIAALMALGGAGSAEVAIAIGAGYGVDVTRYDDECDIVGLSVDAPVFALDLGVFFGDGNLGLIGGVKASFPSEIEAERDDGAVFSERLDPSYALNVQLGIGYRFFKDTRFLLLIGAGATVTSFSYTVDEYVTFKVVSLGAYGTVQGSYYFSKRIGVMLGIDCGYYFLPFLAQWVEDEGETEDMSEVFESSVYFDVRAGITFRL
ncbi:MAG TPA: hypothetical protein PLU93_01605 [Treponemataceae bacterium]|jgi:hypothetical protein|nr:hypothetical protein [Treponemataceae bacterium]